MLQLLKKRKGYLIIQKKGGNNFMRKETKNKVLEVLAKMAMASASKEADSACFLFGYQPKMPDKLKKIKKRR